MFEKHLESIFCDDIRHEQGGKRTLVGTYNTVMYVTSFPISIPKFCILVRALSPAEKPFRKLSLRILKDDEVVFEASEIEILGDDATEQVSDLVPPANQLASATCEIVVSPLKVDNPCSLRIRATDESGKEYAAAGLIITTFPSEPTED